MMNENIQYGQESWVLHGVPSDPICLKIICPGQLILLWQSCHRPLRRHCDREPTSRIRKPTVKHSRIIHTVRFELCERSPKEFYSLWLARGSHSTMFQCHMKLHAPVGTVPGSRVPSSVVCCPTAEETWAGIHDYGMSTRFATKAIGNNIDS
jgi:hypothetical protein